MSKDVRTKIKEACDTLKISRAELSKRLGLHPQTLYNLSCRNEASTVVELAIELLAENHQLRDLNLKILKIYGEQNERA